MSRLSRVFDTTTADRVPKLQHSLGTFQDCVERVLLRFDTTRDSPRGLTMARQAVVDAYRELPLESDWTWLSRRWTFATEAPYTTGTVVYDHTGGSSERLLTLTSGTFPTNAILGQIKIGNRFYDVEKRLSATTLSLAANNNPGADVASTTYEWTRDSYDLPVDYLSNGQLVDVGDTAGEPLEYVSSDQMHSLLRQYPSTQDRANWWSIESSRYLNSMTIRLAPRPSAVRQYELRYKAAPQRLHTEKYSAGTVSITAASTTVTGVDTVWTGDMQGAIIRFSTDSNLEPTSAAGYWDDTADSYNPYVEEAVIHTVGSATSITLGDAARQSLSGVRYTISDPLDIDSPTMYSALMALACYRYAQMALREDVALFRQLYADELARARDADYRNQTFKQRYIERSILGTVDGVP